MEIDVYEELQEVKYELGKISKRSARRKAWKEDRSRIQANHDKWYAKAGNKYHQEYRKQHLKEK